MSTQAQHTPGPWEVNCDEVRPERTKWILAPMTTGKNALVAEAYPQGKNADDPFGHIERDANARLIAAAPELLAALDDIQEYWNGHVTVEAMRDACEYAIATASAAIAKARGEG